MLSLDADDFEDSDDDCEPEDFRLIFTLEFEGLGLAVVPGIVLLLPLDDVAVLADIGSFVVLPLLLVKSVRRDASMLLVLDTMCLSGIGRFTAEVLLPLLVDALVCGVNVLLVIVDPEVLPFPADVSTALMGAAPLFILGRTLVGDFPFLRLVCLLSSSLVLFRTDGVEGVEILSTADVFFRPFDLLLNPDDDKLLAVLFLPELDDDGKDIVSFPSSSTLHAANMASPANFRISPPWDVTSSTIA